MGQSLWLDNITRDLLDNGTLKRYIDELSITGLTSNPTIFDHAVTHSKWTIRKVGGSSSNQTDMGSALCNMGRERGTYTAE